MRIIKVFYLQEFAQRHADALAPLSQWAQDCRQAVWRTNADVKAYARSADYVGNQRWVFNIGGNKYRLVVAICFRKIKTPEEYEASMKLFSALMDKGAKLSADEADYMDLLGTLLEDYERTAHPEVESFLDRKATPVEAIRWAMDRHGLRQKDLGPYIGSEQLISAIMNGAKKLSKSMMVKLHEGLGIPYENMMEIPMTPRYRKVAMF